jgi:heptosyltransferase-1
MGGMRVLLVKTSSLGDVVHNLPVATDIRRQFPEARIDWAVEEDLVEVPRLHPAVAEVIAVAPRRWRKALFEPQTRREIAEVRARLAARGYDFVIDTQGLLKSALIACLAPGRRIGLDWASARELLRPFYHRTYGVAWGRHAVERNRELAALALGYALAQPADYGIGAPALTPPPAWTRALSEQPFAVLLHATSAVEKLWPEHQWVKLGEHLHHRGLTSVLPWGGEAERRRSEHVARRLSLAYVPPRLTLTEASWLLGNARIVFGVDTGLSHLAVALGTPTVGIYCATDPAATGLYGPSRARSVGTAGRPPSVGEIIAAERELLAA